MNRGTAQLRRSPIKRTAIRPKPRPATDRVDPADHLHVRLRDGQCIGILLMTFAPDLGIPWHQCRDAFGNEHSPNAIDKLTADHFHHHAGGTLGDRATSDRAHLVAACHWLNVDHMTATIREGERRYIACRIATGTV